MPLRAPRKGYASAGGIFRDFGIISEVKQESADIERFFRLAWLRKILRGDRRDGTIVPMGGGDVSLVATSDGIFKVLTEEIIEAAAGGNDLSESTAGQDEAPNSTTILAGDGVKEITWTGSLKGAQKLANAGYRVTWVQGGITKILEPGTGSVVTTKTGGGMSLDLGNIIGTGLDLWAQYETVKNLQNSNTQNADFSITDLLGLDGVEGDMPLIDLTQKKKCVKRRRRKRLATKSDLGDLAALKAILGNGEVFKAWVATRGR